MSGAATGVGRTAKDERPRTGTTGARPAAKGAGRAWRRVAFDDLEPVSRREALLLRNVEWLLPRLQRSVEAAEAVSRALEALFEAKVTLSVGPVSVVHGSKLDGLVGEAAFLGLLAPHPHKARGLVEIDRSLANAAVDQLLGATGEATDVRPITELEDGVLTYVLLVILKGLSPGIDPSLPLLRVEATGRPLAELAPALAEDEHFVVVQLHAAIGSASGYVRLFVPEALVAAARPPFGAPARRARRAAEAAARAPWLSRVKTELWTEIGEISILSGDLAQLRERDVVLVDAITARPDRGEGGTVKLRFGAGRAGYVEAQLQLVVGRLSATLVRVVPSADLTDGALVEVAPGAPAAAQEIAGPGEPTSPGDPSQGDDVDASAEAAELLSDIPLQLTVEVGRLPITAEEIVGLKAGHVLDLRRGAAEPVDLSVNGKIIAQGELVEVEGNLGVRILSLVG